MELPGDALASRPEEQAPSPGDHEGSPCHEDSYREGLPSEPSVFAPTRLFAVDGLSQLSTQLFLSGESLSPEQSSGISPHPTPASWLTQQPCQEQTFRSNANLTANEIRPTKIPSAKTNAVMPAPLSTSKRQESTAPTSETYNATHQPTNAQGAIAAEQSRSPDGHGKYVMDIEEVSTPSSTPSSTPKPGHIPEPPPWIIDGTDYSALATNLLQSRGADQNRVISEVTGVGIKKYTCSLESFCSLAPGEWLTDEVLDVYFRILFERHGNPSIHLFNVHLYTKLCNTRLEKSDPLFGTYFFFNILDFLKNVDVFSKDLILIPINPYNGHWLLAAIYPKLTSIEIYDSCHRVETSRMYASNLRSFMNDAWEFGNDLAPFPRANQWTTTLHPVGIPTQTSGKSSFEFPKDRTSKSLTPNFRSFILNPHNRL